MVLTTTKPLSCLFSKVEEKYAPPIKLLHTPCSHHTLTLSDNIRCMLENYATTSVKRMPQVSHFCTPDYDKNKFSLLCVQRVDEHGGVFIDAWIGKPGMLPALCGCKPRPRVGSDSKP